MDGLMAAAGTREAARQPVARGDRPRPRLHLGRLALLALVLIAAAFYVSPLRAFFTEQDRYQREVAALQAARAERARMEREIELLSTRSYVAQVARAESMLVPPGTQVFVVKGLPGRAEEEAFASPKRQATQSSFSVLDRVEDLWRTLLR
jgi:cell division protein FtsB